MNQDARLLLQLDRLQKQPEMRKARLWWRDEFWPDNASDYLKIELAHGKKESRWLKQVPTYWGMATSFVLDGTLSETPFLNADFSQEMFSMFAKSTHSSRNCGSTPAVRTSWRTSSDSF
jgi:hypothetical protein